MSVLDAAAVTALAVTAALAGWAAGQAERGALRRRADVDALTGLLNRAAVLARLTDALRDRRRGGAVAVLFIDLDGFKTVNDTHGHAAGDTVLREVAARLRRAVRPDDVVGRLGGDEFVIVLTGRDAASRASHVATRIQACLVSPMAVAGHTARGVGGSVGVAAAARGEDVTGPQLLARADAAMYQAKTNQAKTDQAKTRPPRPRSVHQSTAVADLVAAAVTRHHHSPPGPPAEGSGSCAVPLLAPLHSTSGQDEEDAPA